MFPVLFPSPSASNPCEGNDGRGPCSHLCLINYNRTASCTCPHLMKLSSNKQSCFGEPQHTPVFFFSCSLPLIIEVKLRCLFPCEFYGVFFFFPVPALKRFLLYVRRSEIRGVDIDNPYMNVMTALTVPDIDDVTVVDYDALEERIYWADVKTQTIKRAFINGTQLETIISAGRQILASKIVFVCQGRKINFVFCIVVCKFVVFLYAKLSICSFYAVSHRHSELPRSGFRLAFKELILAQRRKRRVANQCGSL